MIVVESHLWPGGIRKGESLCRVEIINDVAGTLKSGGSRGDYEVRLYSRGEKPRLIKTARIENFPRNAVPAWRLIQKAFEVLE